MQSGNWILPLLKAADYKLSVPREAIANWIARHKGVFSAGEIIKALPDLDRVSVFRTIDLLQKLDVIHPVLSTHSERHYEVHGKRHHHHAVCSGCEKTACVDCNVKRAKISGFTNLHHSVVFTGLCVACK